MEFLRRYWMPPLPPPVSCSSGVFSYCHYPRGRRFREEKLENLTVACVPARNLTTCNSIDSSFGRVFANKSRWIVSRSQLQLAYRRRCPIPWQPLLPVGATISIQR